MTQARPTPGRTYKGASNEQRRANRRVKLIDAAIAVYGRQGFRKTTVKAVCSEAGLTERYFYEAFLNSEELLLASYNAINERLLGRLREAGAGAPVQAQAAVMMEAFFVQLRASPLEARLFLDELKGLSPAVDAAILAWHDRFGRLLVEVIKSEAAEPLLLRGVVGGVLHIALAWIDEDYATDQSSVSASAIRLCGALL